MVKMLANYQSFSLIRVVPILLNPMNNLHDNEGIVAGQLF